MFTVNNTESRVLKRISDFAKIKTKRRVVKTKDDAALQAVKSIIFNDRKLTSVQKLEKVNKLFK